MALIHVLDKQTENIIATLNNEIGEYYDSLEIKSLENQNTFDFTALKKFEHLKTRNRLLVQDVDGFFSEYIISFSEQLRLGQTPVKEVKANASFMDLKKAKVIFPERREGQTPATAVEFALERTEWKPGDIDFVNIRTITITDLTNPYDFLKQVASTFNLELRFRVEVKGGRIVGRYVDLKKQIAGFDGKEIVFGKDLIGIRRVEDSNRIVTALWGVGPEKDDGKRLAVLVENEEALQRWGRNGQHLIEVYEPESSDQDMTESRLRTLTQNELEKRIDAAVSYECEAVSLEHVFGRSHERIRLGQTVRIKDEGYNPPLYLEARIQEVQENPATRKIVSFKIGNFIEYKKEDLEKQVKLLKKVLAQKVNAAELEALERALQGDISDINEALTDMDEYIEGAFSDGLIEKSEAKAIEKYINSLNTEKTDVDNRYVTVYNDADLVGDPKSNLYNAKLSFNAAYSSLVSSINNAIADGKTTPAEKTDVDNKFTAYRNAIGTLSTRFEQAIRAIEKMKADRVEAEAENFTRGYAETPTGAQQKANGAKEEANQHTDKQVETRVEKTKVIQRVNESPESDPIAGKKIGISLALQGGTPQYMSPGLINFANQWTMHSEINTTPTDWYNWRTFDFVYTDNSMRYLVINLVGGVERAYNPGGNSAVGYIDVRVIDSANTQLAMQSVTAWIASGGAGLQFKIDLGTTYKPHSFYYIQFKARKTGGTGDLLAGLRMSSRYLRND